MKRFPKKRLLVSIIILWFIVAYAKSKHHNQPSVSGKLNKAEMNEISGIAASSLYSDTYYIHNDSGDTSRFFAITPDGKQKAVFYFKGDTRERLGVKDCEDIAVGPGPAAGKSYVYLGDIGDNHSERRFLTVYRFAEAELNTTAAKSDVNAVAVNLKYPDSAKDAETLMVDPLEKLLYIVSKRRGSVFVYTAPLSYKANDTLMLTRRAELHFKGFQPLKWIVAGDISKDGRQILLKSYVKVYYWKRNGNEPVWETMQRLPEELPYEQEKQGEAIGFAPDGKSYYTTSEGTNAPVYHYQVP